MGWGPSGTDQICPQISYKTACHCRVAIPVYQSTQYASTHLVRDAGAGQKWHKSLDIRSLQNTVFAFPGGHLLAALKKTRKTERK